MIILSATNLTKTYGVDEILTNVSFHINEGDRIGIIGVNGAGKTTLLNILAGRLTASAGDFFVSNDTTIGYLRQSDNFHSEKTVYEEMLSIFQPVIDMEAELSSLSEEISEKSLRGERVELLLHKYDDLHEAYKRKNGFGYKSEVRGILNSMAFTDDFFEKKISLLSGGERTRLALAALLLKKPDLLLLDEPTNHLDIGTLKWLEQYLKLYQGTIVIISHDRYFLDQTVNRIFEVENHRLFTYEGNYTAFVEKKRMREADELKRYEGQQKELERQEEIIRRFKQHGTEKLAKRAQSREKRLSHVERLDRPQPKTGKMKITFRQNYQTGNDVIMAKDLSKSFGVGNTKRLLFQNVDLDIKRGERICIVGPNGIGKTTLLKIIMDKIRGDTGYVKLGHNAAFGYYDQEQALLSTTGTVLEELHDTYRLYSETELRGMLGRFNFKNDTVFQQVSSLSGGEKARLSLLKLMLSGANILLMDEPTNHLDIASKEVFEEAILDYPGTLIVVSHDRYFLNRVPTRIMELSRDGLNSYLGGYDYYMEKKQSLGSGKSYLEGLSKAGSVQANRMIKENLTEKEQRIEARRLAKEKEAEERRKERELVNVEEKIDNLEGKIKRLELDMCKEENFANHEKLAKMDEELQKAKVELAEKYQLWEKINT
ncbi:MAG: ABC-F family ATP-binding cassette domain-containing protein [Anaerovorax sp.]